MTDSIIEPSLTFDRAQPSMTTCKENIDSALLFFEKTGEKVSSNGKLAKTLKTLCKVFAGKPITENDELDQAKDHIQKNKPLKSKAFDKLLKKSYKKS